jgi:uncharacterized protein (DUF1697 family)
MARQVALLRGVNLGARNRIGMARLRELVEGLGYADVRTHLQSGNVVFSARVRPATAARRIAEQLAAEGLPVDVLVRTAGELDEVVRADPLGDVASNPKRYLVIFLSAAADEGASAELDPGKYEPERFAVCGREVYTWFPDGVQSAKLSQAFWERRLGVRATARNWDTVVALRDMAVAS